MSDVHPGFEKLTRERKQDARGSLFEFLRNVPGGAQIYVFTIEPGQIRGNHWHNRKCEWFACVNGSATLVLRADQGRADPAELSFLADMSTVVRVDPGVRHTFSSIAGATILACISESFDPTDPDTYFE